MEGRDSLHAILRGGRIEVPSGRIEIKFEIDINRCAVSAVLFLLCFLIVDGSLQR